MLTMDTCKVFPKWLSDYIFVQLGAKERPDPNEFKLNLESGADKNIDYLGTYFPRSYAESFCIHQNLFSYQPYKERLYSKTSLRILTFGCGTGGDVTGLICAIAMMLPNIQDLDVVAFDGNNLALDHLSDILGLPPLEKRFNIKIRCVPMPIKSMQDLNHYTSHLGNGYDIILSFKFVNELMQMGILGRDGFKVIAERLAPLLAPEGLMTLLDVRAEYCGEWQPKNLNKGISDYCKESYYGTLLPIPCHFCDSRCRSEKCFTDKKFYGSFTANDQVTYRVVGHRAFVNALYPVFNSKVTYMRNKDMANDPCPMTRGRDVKDAYDINN